MPCLGPADYEEIKILVARDLFEGTIAACLLEVSGEAERHGIEVPPVVIQWKADLERLRAMGKKMAGPHPFGSSDRIPSMKEESQYLYPEGWMQRMVRMYRHGSLGASMLCYLCRRLADMALLDQCSAVTRGWWREHCAADREKGALNEFFPDLKNEAALYPEVLSLYMAMCDSSPAGSSDSNEPRTEQERFPKPSAAELQRPASYEHVLGIDPRSGRQISVRMGRYGPFVQSRTMNDDEKPKFAGLAPGQTMDTITLEDALALLELPSASN